MPDVYELHHTAEGALRGGGSSGAQIAAVPSLQHSVYLRHACRDTGDALLRCVTAAGAGQSASPLPHRKGQSEWA
jgi:hypothetical protein